MIFVIFFFSSRRRHTRYIGDWSSDVCSSDLSSVASWIRNRKKWRGFCIAISLGSPLGMWAFLESEKGLTQSLQRTQSTQSRRDGVHHFKAFPGHSKGNSSRVPRRSAAQGLVKCWRRQNRRQGRRRYLSMAASAS